MIDLDKISYQVVMICRNSDLYPFFNIKHAYIFSRKFISKYKKLDDAADLLDLNSIAIESNEVDRFSYIVCNLFKLQIAQITTHENIYVSHDRILTK